MAKAPAFVVDTWEPGGSEAAGPDPSVSGFESQQNAHAPVVEISYFVQAVEDVALLEERWGELVRILSRP